MSKSSCAANATASGCDGTASLEQRAGTRRSCPVVEGDRAVLADVPQMPLTELKWVDQPLPEPYRPGSVLLPGGGSARPCS
jgi:hypothetical protein